MKKRIISGVIMAILLVIIYVCPPIVFDIAVGILAAGAYYELTKVRKDLTIPNIMKYIGFIFLMLIMYMNIDTISYSFGIDYTSLTIGFIIMFIPTAFTPTSSPIPLVRVKTPTRSPQPAVRTTATSPTVR